MASIMMLCAIASPDLSAQQGQIEVKGKVTSQGEPVIGAGVLVKGTTTGTATDMDGNFVLNVRPDAVLTVSSIGYTDAEVSVNGRGYIEVELAPESLALDDVVVVGYGTQKKINLTGAVASVDTEVMENRPIANAVEALQGSVPGLVIQQGTSTPGSSPSMNIRGLNTLNNNDPLVIIDGLEGSLANLNPSDIDQISVLKDASSTAIYGSRASNGVILVTTKKGQEGKMEVSYDFNYGFQMPTSLPKLVDSWIYAELYNEAEVNSGRPAKFTPEDIAGFRNNGPNVNWVRSLYDDWSPQHSHSVSMTGGTDKLSYMASIGYLDQDSMFKGSKDYGYKRFNARMNLSHKVTDRLTINLTSQFARNTITDHAYDTYWIVEQANRMPPIYDIKNPDGTYAYPSGSNANGLQRIEQGGYTQSVNDELAGTLSAEWELFDGFKLIGSIGARTWNNGKHTHRNALEGSSADVLDQMQEESYRSLYTNANAMATYDRTIDRHTFGVMLGYAYEGFSEKSFWTRRDNINNKYDIMVGSLSGDDVSNGAGASDWSMYSGFARLTYNYDEKYLLEVNIRNDYSSYFAKGNRSGLFPSVSAGWSISEEPWMAEWNQKMGLLKIRASYGTLGNQAVSDYQYFTTYDVYTNTYGFNNVAVAGAGFQLGTDNLQWEVSKTLNVGFDAGFFKNSLTIGFDYFNKHTTDILITPETPLHLGTTLNSYNAGEMRTQGWELTVNWSRFTDDWTHNLTFNIGDSWNRVLHFEGYEQISQSDEIYRIIREGLPLYSYFGYKTDGFFQSYEEIENSALPAGMSGQLHPGDIKYVDQNGDGVINENDRVYLGNAFPRYTFGLNYAVSWKGIDLSIMFQGVLKRDMMLRGELVEPFHENYGYTMYTHQLDYWTPTNTDARWPRLTYTSAQSEQNNYGYCSDIQMFNASYLRLKDLQIGYTFPKKWMDKVGIEKLRIYFDAQNLFTVSGISFLDPESSEFGNSMNAGGANSGRNYPNLRYFGMGLDFTF